MYLNRLNNEQKELFLDLCIQASMANNDFANEQKELIKLYCDEMQLANVRYEANTVFEDTMAKVTDISSKSELKIIVLELTALILSDNKYDELESAFMDRVIKMTGIDDTQHKEMLEALDKLSAIYKRLNQMVLGG